MNRKQAVQVIRQIYDECDYLDSSWIALMPPNADDVLSKGFQIHIRNDMSSYNKNCVEEIIQKYGLKINFEGNIAVIYRPIKS